MRKETYEILVISLLLAAVVLLTVIATVEFQTKLSNDAIYSLLQSV